MIDFNLMRKRIASKQSRMDGLINDMEDALIYEDTLRRVEVAIEEKCSCPIGLLIESPSMSVRVDGRSEIHVKINSDLTEDYRDRLAKDLRARIEMSMAPEEILESIVITIDEPRQNFYSFRPPMSSIWSIKLVLMLKAWRAEFDIDRLD